MSPEQEIASAEAANLNLSFFNIGSGSPGNTVWEKSDKATVEDMSAVLFWFGRHLEQNLAGIPIGLIHSAVSATAIERWSTVAGSGGLYVQQITPLQPYAIRGVLWYQGEWDARSANDAEKYYWQLPALIDEWRADWGQGNFPFYVVQMPRMGISNIHIVRDAELQTALSTPEVEITVNVDYPEIDVHPTHKQPFGSRLADIALNTIHGHAVTAFGPVYDVSQSYAVENEIFVGFNHIGGGLSSDGEPAEWEIAGADGVYVEAVARINGNTVVVSSNSVENPVSVRYAFKPAPVNPNLFNIERFPASPIREIVFQATPDTIPPHPDPMTWEVSPYATSSTSVAMEATTASDESGVEYYFDNVSGNGNDSGWQDGTVYTDTGLQPDSTYGYSVLARDKSGNLNETAWSTTELATTTGGSCTANTMYVNALTANAPVVSQGSKIGRATVTILDDCGDTVSGVSVMGTFTGDFNETQSADTNFNGVTVVDTVATARGGISFTFCVDSIIGGDINYFAEENVVTCVNK